MMRSSCYIWIYNYKTVRAMKASTLCWRDGSFGDRRRIFMGPKGDSNYSFKEIGRTAR
jgi:hypothetical protein